MAAGLGFKTFVTGDVLTAGDTNGYLMQGVLVFASAAARDSAITSPQEGQFAYTKDTNGLWYYDGAAWVASGAAGDIEGVTAGTGISGGGTSGTVTITNSMATAIDAKGDLVVGTGADTFSRLAVGATNGHVLTVDSVEATGLKWAAAGGGGGKVLQVVSTFKDDTFTSSAITFADITGLSATITPSAATSKVLILSNINLGGTTSVNGSGARLLRGATAIGVGAAAGVRASLNISSTVGGDDDYVGSYSYVYLDSPATTSATTYKWQSYEQAGTTFVNRGQGDGNSTSQFRTASNIILLEIGA